MTKKLPRPAGIPDTFLTIKEAVNAFDVSQRTLKRDKAAGKIDAKKDKRGWNYFDPAELSREYGTRKQSGIGDNIGQTNKVAQFDTPPDTPLLEYKISVLEEKNEALLEQLKLDREDSKKREELQQREKEKLLGIVEKQTLMLEYHRETTEENKPKPNDRWLVWGLAAFTTAIGVVAAVAIYFLRAGA